MKKLFLIILIALAGWSCSEDEKSEAVDFDEKWVLVKMSGSAPNSETIGENMEWQEFYLLRSDGTFSKQRERDGMQTSGAGIYSIVEEENTNYLELIYNTNNTIIGSCFGDNKERLWFVSPNQLTSTWLACDGPGLEYERISMN